MAAQELVVPRSMPMTVLEGLVTGTGLSGRPTSTFTGPALTGSTRCGARRSAWAGAPGAAGGPSAAGAAAATREGGASTGDGISGEGARVGAGVWAGRSATGAGA